MTQREGRILRQGNTNKKVFIYRYITEGSFDAYSYYTLSYALDSHNVGRGRGGVAKALDTIKAHSIIITIDSDNLFPVEESRVWNKLVPGAEYIEISSRFGHDGFLLETERLTEILRKL